MRRHRLRFEFSPEIIATQSFQRLRVNEVGATVFFGHQQPSRMPNRCSVRDSTFHAVS